jgi:hypothetical protein
MSRPKIVLSSPAAAGGLARLLGGPAEAKSASEPYVLGQEVITTVQAFDQPTAGGTVTGTTDCARGKVSTGGGLRPPRGQRPAGDHLREPSDRDRFASHLGGQSFQNPGESITTTVHVACVNAQ